MPETEPFTAPDRHSHHHSSDSHGYRSTFTMILIENILLDDALVSTPFLCDTKKCKGACCTVKGGQGAPLLDVEIEAVEHSIAAASNYLSERSKAEIAAYGAYEGTSGEYTTRCIEDADCVFVFYDGDVAKCAIEKAYYDGATDFQKPISCHLFPIRLTDFHGPYLYYDKFSECSPALTHGAELGVHIPETVKDALIRAFGEQWYAALDNLVQESKTKPRKN
jgi:hypothetical protein